MQEWFVTRRGRGLYTRTVALPLWARFFLPCTILQSAILIGINVAIGVLAEDCLTWLILALSSLVTLFMCYFAIEAVRTENAYQCAFLLPNPTPAVCCARLKLSFSHVHTRARLHKIIVRRLAAYFNTTFVFLSGYLPPIMGMSDGPHHVPMSAKHAEQVRMLILASLICTGVLQL